MNRIRDRKPRSAVILSLLAILGLLAAVQPAASAAPVSSITTIDGDHSANGYKLVDGQTGTFASDSWINADNRWDAGNYPMDVTLDLGSVHYLHSVRFYSGQIPFPSTAKVLFAASVTSATGPFSYLGKGTSPGYDRWSDPVALSSTARYVNVRFDSLAAHFNISELEIDATPVITTTPTTNTVPTTVQTTVSTGQNSTTTTAVNTTTTATTTATTATAPNGTVSDAYPQTSTIDSFGQAARPNTDLGPGWAEVDAYYAMYPRQANECPKELHNQYWVMGQDNKVHPTWHPTVHPSGCSFAHEHGDDPRTSDLYDVAMGVPFAITSGFDGGMPHTEGHPGYKTTVQNDYELVIGNPFNEGPITPTGITCDWLSNLHQGSSTDNALKNNAHAYQLNNSCSDGVELRIKAILTFGPPEIVTNLCSTNGTEQFDTNLDATMGSPVVTALDGKREFQCLDDAYGEQFWKPPTKKWFEELWKADGVIELPGNGQKINFSPYYAVHDPQRYIDHEWAARGLPNAYISTLDLCFNDNASYRDAEERPSFCDFAPSALNGLSGEARQRSVDNPMKGAIRSIHPKNFDIRAENVVGGEANFVRFCTNARGLNASVLEAGESCPDGRIEQFVARQDRWGSGIAGSMVNSQMINGQLIGSGMFQEWTRDFSDPSIRYPN